MVKIRARAWRAFEECKKEDPMAKEEQRTIVVSERGIHGFRTIVRKMGRMKQEDKAAIYRLLDPNPAMIFGNKAAYEALPDKEKAAFDAATIEGWINGMEEALRSLEALTDDGTIKILPKEEGGGNGETRGQAGGTNRD